MFFESKYDGERIQIHFKKGHQIRYYNRSLKDKTQKFEIPFSPILK